MNLPPEVKRIRVRQRVATFYMKEGGNRRQDGEQRRTLTSVQRACRRHNFPIPLEEGTDIYNESTSNGVIPEEDCMIDISIIRSVLANSTWIAKPKKKTFPASHILKTRRRMTVKQTAANYRNTTGHDHRSGSSLRPYKDEEQQSTVTGSCETTAPTHQRHSLEGQTASTLLKMPNVELHSVRKSVPANKLLYIGPPKSDRKTGKWPDGWTMEIYERQSGRTKGMTDKYFFSPKKKYRLRSMVEVERFLEEMVEHKGDETIAFYEVEKWKADRTK